MDNFKPTQRLGLRCLSVLLASGLATVGSPHLALTQTATDEKPKAILNTASYSYSTPDGDRIEALTNQLEQPLIDPFGVITGCNGELLPSYAGFSVGLYNPDGSGFGLGSLVDLTTTEVPDIPGNGVPAGLQPNNTNANPFPVNNLGQYNFLFDEAKGQLDIGRSFIMVVQPPAGSTFAERRVLLTITGRNGNDLSYRATAIDGRALDFTTGATEIEDTLDIASAISTGLTVATLNTSVATCDAEDVQITKSADRGAAEPGDTVLYRLSVRNLSSSTLNNLVVTDEMPPGFNLLEDKVRATIGNSEVPVTVSRIGRTVRFQVGELTLAPTTSNEAVLNIIYPAQLTPDAMRGDGENLASVNGARTDNSQPVQDGPARHRMRVRSGILSECGTLLGRVFNDLNFDGEQQPGEPGIPNAVIILDDGNRVTTDQNGLFHLASVVAGQRTGVLDAESVPGYTLAPNQKFIGNEGQSRLVQLAPGGLARMNFAVTPAAEEAEPCNCEN